MQFTSPTSYISNSDQGNWADEFTRFLRGADVVSGKAGVQSISTHAIAATGASSHGNFPNFIRALANQGRGQYYSASSMSALASASLPESVNAQSTYENQVFVGVFRPDAAGLTGSPTRTTRSWRVAPA